MSRVSAIFAALLVTVSFAHAIPVSVHQEAVEEEDVMPSPVAEAPAPVNILDGILPVRKLGTSFKINCGGDSFGDFQSDVYGRISGETGSYMAPSSAVVGDETAPSIIYASHRHGLLMVPFGYDLPLETPGVYNCNLNFGETYPEYFFEGGRVFGVSATGAADAMTQTGIDMFLETGGDMTKAVTKTFAGIHATDMISFYITPTAGEAFISGISCMKVADL